MQFEAGDVLVWQFAGRSAPGAVGHIGWLEGVREHSFDLASHRLSVGSPDRLLIVGQAPARGMDDRFAFAGDKGAAAKLRALLGVATAAALRDRCDLLNAWPLWEGGAGSGDHFDARKARELCDRLHVRARQVLLLGAAADAFGLASMVPTRYFSARKSKAHPGAMFYLVPHPSGVNRWWNDLGNRARAQDFFDRVRGWPEMNPR